MKEGTATPSSHDNDDFVQLDSPAPRDNNLQPVTTDEVQDEVLNLQTASDDKEEGVVQASSNLNADSPAGPGSMPLSKENRLLFSDSKEEEKVKQFFRKLDLQNQESSPPSIQFVSEKSPPSGPQLSSGSKGDFKDLEVFHFSELKPDNKVRLWLENSEWGKAKNLFIVNVDSCMPEIPVIVSFIGVVDHYEFIQKTATRPLSEDDFSLGYIVVNNLLLKNKD